MVISFIACNDTGEIETKLTQESQNDTTEKAPKVKLCNFISGRKVEISVNSQLLDPPPPNSLPEANELLDSASYNKYMKGKLSFVDDYEDYEWISADRVKGIANNIMLVSFEKKGRFKDRDTYVVAFSEDCKVLDKLLVATFRTFQGGSTQKFAQFESDTIKIGTVVSDKLQYSQDNLDGITYRKFYFDNELKVFMIAEEKAQEAL